MKITTWNVNGIRAVLNKGIREFVQSTFPDVFCVQEIKARPDQVEQSDRLFDGYTGWWNPAERPGYSGVASFFRSNPYEVTYGLGIERFDREGRVIRSKHEKFTLYNIYFPNGQRGQDRVDFKLEFYAELLAICKQMMREGEEIILTGDFNTAHTEIDLANPKSNEKTSGFLPEERKWIDIYLESGFIDLYRYLYPDTIQYTWWTYITRARERNIGWRLDYFLATKGILERVDDVVIHDEVMGSDHCPVSLMLRD